MWSCLGLSTYLYKSPVSLSVCHQRDQAITWEELKTHLPQCGGFSPGRGLCKSSKLLNDEEEPPWQAGTRVSSEGSIRGAGLYASWRVVRRARTSRGWRATLLTIKGNPFSASFCFFKVVPCDSTSEEKSLVELEEAGEMTSPPGSPNA